jgi:hypothetical protein
LGFGVLGLCGINHIPTQSYVMKQSQQTPRWVIMHVGYVTVAHGWDARVLSWMIDVCLYALYNFVKLV